MQIVVNGLLTHYEKQGKGKLVLMLHGWGDSSAGLKGVIKSLSQDYQVVALDLPGFGATQPPKDVWNLDNYADFVEAFLSKLELPQPYGVVAHSNGGALSIRAVALGNLKPDRLVLLAASGIRSSKKFKRFLLKVLAKTGNIATVWMPERYRQGLRQSLYGAVGSDMLVVPTLEETFKKTVRQDTQKDAAKVVTKTLLIYAANDTDIPPADGERYNKLMPNSHLEVVANAGHFVHRDAPDQVNKLIKDFLA